MVVTNPPFSLFREYIEQVIATGKKFLAIGNVNAITYLEIFDHIKEDRMWLGVSIHSGDREFGVPRDYPMNAANCRVDAMGNRFIRVKGVRWFTNMDNKQRHEKLALGKQYNPSEYPKYDNFDAIEVGKVADIPIDYKNLMGVPITFLDKYNPQQFEILGSYNNGKHGEQLGAKKTIAISGGKSLLWNGPVVNKRPLYKRIVIRLRDFA